MLWGKHWIRVAPIASRASTVTGAAREARGPRGPHDLRRGHRRVPHRPQGHRPRPDADAARRVPRIGPRRPTDCDHRRLASFSSTRWRPTLLWPRRTSAPSRLAEHAGVDVTVLCLFGSNTSPLRHHRIPSTPDSGSRIEHWGAAHHWAPVSEARDSSKIYDSQVVRCQPPAGRATTERSSVDGIESLVRCGHRQGQRGHVATGTEGHSRMLETFETEEVERCALARRPPFEPVISARRAGMADPSLSGNHLLKSPKSATDPRERGESPSIGARETETRGGRFADDAQKEESAHSRWGRASPSLLAGREP